MIPMTANFKLFYIVYDGPYSYIIYPLSRVKSQVSPAPNIRTCLFANKYQMERQRQQLTTQLRTVMTSTSNEQATRTYQQL